MNLRFLSINQLSELTGKDRRTIKDRLTDVPAHSEDKRGSYYDTHIALERIFEPKKTVGGMERQLLTEELRLEKARADKMELEVQEMHGRLVPVEDVVKAVEREYTFVRSQFRALPSKLAKPLSMITDPNQVYTRLTEAVDECLSELTADQKFEDVHQAVRSASEETSETNPPEAAPEVDNAIKHEELLRTEHGERK
jgi:phage terminase Nu1 subunit (DNA packaging protein)